MHLKILFITICFAVLFEKTWAYTKIEVGPHLPFEYDVQLTEIRKISLFFTDPSITSWQKMPVPKRKKALVRYVKRLNERLEYGFVCEGSADEKFYNDLFELIWIKKSFEDKINRNFDPSVGFADKYRMWKHTRKSKKRKWKFEEEEFVPSKFSKYFVVDYPDTLKLEKRFSTLAKRKKIKVKDTMVVVFDKTGTDGSAPKCETWAIGYDDAWVIKWGDEIHTDIAGSRLFAALGFDVDHPYFFGKEKVFVVFNEWSSLPGAEEMLTAVSKQYGVDIRPYVSSMGKLTSEIIGNNKDLKKFESKMYVTFIKCSMEARPDRVKRIGSFLPDEMHDVSELRESLLAHAFIGNWDIRNQNTLLTLVHDGNYKYHLSAVFSDLGTSFGVKRNYTPADFKTGLVNEFGWQAVKNVNGKIQLLDAMNAKPFCFQMTDYMDLYRMAIKISKLDENCLKHIIGKTHWPKPIADLYFNKLVSRRESILAAFGIKDPHPIKYKRRVDHIENGEEVIRNDKLMMDYDRKNNPESFFEEKGRFRNYGN